MTKAIGFGTAVAVLIVCGMTGLAGTVAAQYPTKPIRLIVPYPPGGGNDAIARMLAQKFPELLGQQLIVDNRPGAGTTIGTALAARATADGYTIMMSSVATHAMAPQLYAKPGYDAIRDFAPVSLLATTPMLLVVGAGTPHQTLKDLVAAAKAATAKLTYASGGNGTPPHLSAAIFEGTIGAQMVHVPYKGSGPALVDVMAGQVTFIIDTAASATPHVRSGKLRALAITGRNRWPDLPEVPTFAEGGFATYDASSWYAIHAPAGAPAPAIARLNTGLAAIVKLPDMRERLRLMSAEPVGGTPAELDVFVKAEFAKWGKVIRGLNLKVE
jgi:tripartite-type tricarboxylate transporter receptor subunit TctC